MRTTAWLAACAAVLLASGAACAEQGVVRGTVASVTPVQAEGKTLYTLTVKGEGPWQAALTVGPESKQAYDLVSRLKPGERVAVAWVSEGDRQYVREISRIGEGERKEAERPRAEGERTEGEKEKAVRREGGDRELDERALAERREREAREGLKEKARREREGDRVKEGARDAEVKDEARVREEVARDREAAVREKEEARRRDREAVEVEAKDRARREPMERERREGEIRKEGVRDGEIRKEGARDGEIRKEGVRDGEVRKEGARDGEIRKEGVRDGEGERREDAARMKAVARVVSVETNDENTRVLKLAALEGGEEMTFTVRANQGELYDLVGGLKPGATVRVAWKTERGVPVLVGVSRAGEER